MSRYKKNQLVYEILAKPEEVCGRKFDSRLEGYCAKILIGNNVMFTTHVPFELYTYDGKTYTYSPDFIFPKAMDFVGIEKAVHFIEVKGVFHPHDFKRLAHLEDQYNVKGFIVTEQLLQFWSKHGLYKKPHPEWSNRLMKEEFYDPQERRFI